MPIERNDLETSRFGIVSAHLTDPSASLAQVNAAAAAQGVRMLVARVPTADLIRAQRLEADGYRLMDTLVWYGRALCGLPAPAPVPEEETIRLATPEDIAAVADIARAAFADYGGHYHADPRLSAQAADAAYVEWAETGIRASGDAAPVLVTETGGQTTGFLILRLSSPETAEIVLNAVRPEVQNRGIYGRLLERGMALCRDAGRDHVTVSTQITNIPVQKAWARRGFRLERSLYTFHKWFD